METARIEDDARAAPLSARAAIERAMLVDFPLEMLFEEARLRARRQFARPRLRQIDLTNLGGRVAALFSFTDAALRFWYTVQLTAERSVHWETRLPAEPGLALVAITDLKPLAISPATAFELAVEAAPNARFDSATIAIKEGKRLWYRFFHSTDGERGPRVTVDAWSSRVTVERVSDPL